MKLKIHFLLETRSGKKFLHQILFQIDWGQFQDR
jgi:hypothetical protein